MARKNVITRHFIRGDTPQSHSDRHKQILRWDESTSGIYKNRESKNDDGRTGCQADEYGAGTAWITGLRSDGIWWCCC